MSFSILSYNVMYDLNKKHSKNKHFKSDKVHQAILDHDADIVCLQETNPDWEKFLDQYLKDKYPTQKYLHNRQIGGAILLKKDIKLINYQEITLKEPESWFPFQLLKVKVKNVEITIANIHLCPSKSKDGGLYNNFYYYFFESTFVRYREIKEIVMTDLIDIVIGDYNENHEGYACFQMGCLGYKDSLDLSENQLTWNWEICGYNLTASLDHCFYSPRLEAVECTSDLKYRGISDHLPVFSKFNFAKQN